MRLLALVIALSCFGNSAFAQSSPGYFVGNFLSSCREAFADVHQSPTQAEAFDQGICTGIIATILAHAGRYDADYRFCPPNGTTVKQAGVVVVHAIDGRLDLMNVDLRALALIILRQTWPCTK